MPTYIMHKKQQKKNFLKNFTLILGIILLAIVILLLIGSFISKTDPTKMSIKEKFQLPSAAHICGTDQFGRDILSRIMFSMRYVFLIGIGSVTIGAIIGFVLGSIAGIDGGFLKSVIMSVIDGLVAFPGILLAMMIVFILGKGIYSSLISIGVMMVPSFAKLSYSTILENKSKLYVQAARSYGLSDVKIVIKHIFPEMLPRLITQFTSSVAGAILVESSLSFLGLGVQPPNASLGLMLSESRQFVLQEPFIAIPPGIALIIVVLSFNLIGDFLNDYIIKK